MKLPQGLLSWDVFLEPHFILIEFVILAKKKKKKMRTFLPIVFGYQASTEMQEMVLTVTFRGHLGGGGQIDFFVFSVTFGKKGL